jgi:Flp pilus assembly secretin CpaC
MLQSSSKLPAPGRLFLPGCAIAAGLLAVSSPVLAAPALKANSKSTLVKKAGAKSALAKTAKTGTARRAAKVAAAPRVEAVSLRIGQAVSYAMDPQTTYRIESGEQNVMYKVADGTLSVKAVAPGQVLMHLNSPQRPARIIRLSLTATKARVENRSLSQVVQRTETEGGTPAPAPTPPTASNTSEMEPAASTTTAPGEMGATATDAPSTTSSLSTDLSTDLSAPTPPAPSLPALAPPVITNAVPAPAPAPARAATVAPRAPQISNNVVPPARNKTATVGYRTAARVPQNIQASGSSSINVTQGLARLLQFPSNILAVFFSDPKVMDARAINARTIAVTGMGTGPSTLAVFTSRYEGDAVGRANIYRIQTVPAAGRPANDPRNPRVLEATIASAIGDPRVRTSVISRPDGTLVARLSGSVRNEAEVQAARETAGFFVPAVTSSLYADTNAPTLDAVLTGSLNATPESGMQESLRRITGNQTIELVPLPTGLAFKAEVDTPEEAEALMRVLPTLNQQVIPFIVVRGQSSTSYYNATVPLLSGEDRQLTQKLHDVTGIRTVYAVRTASNALACYGNVRTRTEYDTVRRYMMIAAQNSAPPATQGATQGGQTLRPQGNEGLPLASYNPTGGYRQNLGLQMFVRITDPTQSVIRKVTIETNIVEISRTALRNLGVEYGTATLTRETVTGGVEVQGANGQVTTSPVIVNREIDPTFNAGTALAGNGFGGLGPTGWLNPFRARLNAIVNNGDARILARPNVTSVEGSPAQITIGGERPVPMAVATQGAVGTQVEFRRYGVIISMRPTVSGDNNIILQIRADVTQPDRTFEINLNGALIPGETVRSVDTVINVRPGDTIVMGGLMTNERRQQTSKVPILGDLPIIGSLFRSKRYENNETELAIFMTPQIQTTPSDMNGIEDMLSAPSFPSLPSRQESGSILFQDTTRQAG